MNTYLLIELPALSRIRLGVETYMTKLIGLIVLAIGLVTLTSYTAYWLLAGHTARGAHIDTNLGVYVLYLVSFIGFTVWVAVVTIMESREVYREHKASKESLRPHASM